jgi:hypothetical protein
MNLIYAAAGMLFIGGVLIGIAIGYIGAARAVSQ